MKLKEQKKFGILWLSVGAALFLAGLLLGETGYSSYISGFGGALMGVCCQQGAQHGFFH